MGKRPPPRPASPAPGLRLTPEALATLRRAFHRAGGVEPCGYLLAEAGCDERPNVREAVVGRNTHPLPERAYRLEPEEQLRVSRAARARGLRVVGYWHGHLVGPPVPSRADLDGATVFGPSLHLIVGKDDESPPRVTAWRALQHGPEAGSFREIPIEVR